MKSFLKWFLPLLNFGDTMKCTKCGKDLTLYWDNVEPHYVETLCYCEHCKYKFMITEGSDITQAVDECLTDGE